VNALVPLALFGFPAVAALAFLLMPTRRALLLTYFGGWLFLPVASYEFSGLPTYDKAVAVSLGAGLGVLVRDPGRLLAFRPGLADLALAVWCLCSIPTSLFNGLGLYDGLSNTFARLAPWAVPYVLGRVYFRDRRALVELVTAFAVAAAVYLPLVLWEVRMSPQLHTKLYGFYQHSGGFAQAMRGGGFRPLVFQHHGLMLGLFMVLGCLAAYVLWVGRIRRRVFGAPVVALFGALLACAVLLKSLGAMALGAMGGASLLAVRRLGTGLPLAALVMIPWVYCAVRAPGLWTGEDLVQFVHRFQPERADSLDYRLEAENLLAAKAMEQPIFGWAGYNRGFPPWSRGPGGVIVPDGLWIIAFNINGAFGLVALLSVFSVPWLLLAWRVPPKRWLRPEYAPAGYLALLLSLFAIDNLMNAMVNPLYLLAAGALTSYTLALSRRGRPRTSRRPSPRAAGRDGQRSAAEVSGAGPRRLPRRIPQRPDPAAGRGV
jgi:hypothetical protein